MCRHFMPCIIANTHKTINMTSFFRQAFAVLSWALFFTFCTPAPKAMAQYDDTYVSYNDFYENLAPYGQWIEDPQYGYVWSPNEDGNFRPYYTNGNWVMTEYGNTWVSDYPWGWAPFHYGRWTYDNYYGWLWIPGSNWGPAWVSWRSGDGYFGWAPLGPGYEFGSNYVDYYCPNDWWVFIPPQYVYGGNYYRYWYGPNGNNHIIQNTTFINNTYVTNNVTYVSGPHVKQVEAVTSKPVQVYKLTRSNNLNTRVHNNTVRMYRPNEIRPVSSTGGPRVSPPNVVAAPQPVRPQQPVNTGQANPRTFRDDNPRPGVRGNDQIGSNISETAKPQPQHPRTTTTPYEWDANNRSVPQTPREEPRQQPVQQQPRQQPQSQQPRAQPLQPQQPRQAPAATPAPAQQAPKQNGRR